MSVSTLASFEYLEELPGTTFRRLYQQPSTALAIFRRMLPHLAKTFVMALLYMTEPIPTKNLYSWVHPMSTTEAEKALVLLNRLHMVIGTQPTRDQPVQTVVIAKHFGVSLRNALTGGGEQQSFGVPYTDVTEGEVSIDILDEYARQQWEGILHCVVSSVARTGREGSNGPTDSVKRLLQAGRLITPGRGSITQEGFAFLLQESNAQVWTVLLLWIKNAEQMGTGLDNVEILGFLFMLGSLELGRAYSTQPLTEPQRRMLTYLVDFGLVYTPGHNNTHFFPTRLATTLTSDAGALRTVSAGFDAAASNTTGTKGFIILETNYRLYAYTNSPLQIAVLSLFAKLHHRYPNMVSGRISRLSVGKAIEQGITSQQIIAYLGTHAHPQLAKKAAQDGTPVLPPTVVDQIRLWEIESVRMTTIPGFLFKDFDNQKEYEACAKYATEIDVLQWKNDAKRMFFVTRHEALRDYIKARKVK